VGVYLATKKNSQGVAARHRINEALDDQDKKHVNQGPPDEIL